MTPEEIIEAIRQLNDWDLKAVIESSLDEMRKRRSDWLPSYLAEEWDVNLDDL